MDSNSVSQILKKRSCSLCKHCLSVPPIMTEGLENELYKCGRCENVTCRAYTKNNVVIYVNRSESMHSRSYPYQNTPALPKSYRIRLFEDIAQYLSFPCSYPQCNKKIPWSRVLDHERSCSRKLFRCPIYYQNCAKIIGVDELRKHFLTKHPANIVAMGSVMEVNNLSSGVYLLSVNNKYFFIYVLQKGWLAVLSFQSSEYTKFNIKMQFSVGNNFALSFDNLPVVRFDDRLHCYMCFMDKCSEPYHPFSNRNDKGSMKRDSFATKLQNELVTGFDDFKGNLRYCVTLTADPTIVKNQQSRTEAENDTVEDEEEGAHGTTDKLQITDTLRRTFSCPYCMTYMVAPIYTCTTGHSVCKLCKSKLVKCPTCAASFDTTRNFALEELANELMVPCQYDFEGCSFMGVPSKMSTHELECAFNNVTQE